MTYTINGIGTALSGERELTNEEFKKWSEYFPYIAGINKNHYKIATESLVVFFIPIIPLKTIVYYYTTKGPMSSEYRIVFYPASEDKVYWEHVKKSWVFYLVPLLIGMFTLFTLWSTAIPSAPSSPTSAPITTSQIPTVAPATSVPSPAPHTLANPQTLGPPPIYIPGIEREIFDLVNKERQAGGIAPLRWNQKIADIARAYSEEQSVGGFAHKDVTGKGPGERIKDAGLFYVVAGENLALVDRDSLSAKLIVQLWMGSPGHRSAILDRDELFSDAGVGVYCTAQECYATIDFVGLKKQGEVKLTRNYFTSIYLYDPSYGFQATSVPIYIKVTSSVPIDIYITSMDEYNRFFNRGGEGQLPYLSKTTKIKSFERNYMAKNGEVLVFEASYGDSDIQYDFDYRKDEPSATLAPPILVPGTTTLPLAIRNKIVADLIGKALHTAQDRRYVVMGEDIRKMDDEVLDGVEVVKVTVIASDGSLKNWLAYYSKEGDLIRVYKMSG